jgi:hypothetical protein
MFFKQSEKVICAFCQLTHRVYTKKEVSFLDTLVMLMVTGLLAFAIWEGPDLRSMLLFMGMAFTAQVSLRMRYRASVKCPHCGFDPIVYKYNPGVAAKQVKEFLELRRDNPEFLLRSQPKIKPLYLSREQIQALRKAENELESIAPSMDLSQETPLESEKRGALGPSTYL